MLWGKAKKKTRWSIMPRGTLGLNINILWLALGVIYVQKLAFVFYHHLSVKNTQFEVDSGEHPPGFIRPQAALTLFLPFNKTTVVSLVGEKKGIFWGYKGKGSHSICVVSPPDWSAVQKKFTSTFRYTSLQIIGHQAKKKRHMEIK